MTNNNDLLNGKVYNKYNNNNNIITTRRCDYDDHDVI